MTAVCIGGASFALREAGCHWAQPGGSLRFPGSVMQPQYLMHWKGYLDVCLVLRCTVLVRVCPCYITSCTMWGLGVSGPQGLTAPLWLWPGRIVCWGCSVSLGSEPSDQGLGKAFTDSISHQDFFHISFLSSSYPITGFNTKQWAPVIHKNPPWKKTSESGLKCRHKERNLCRVTLWVLFSFLILFFVFCRKSWVRCHSSSFP